MSTTVNEVARASQEQILATVKQSQEAVVEAVSAWAKAVEGMIPAAPALPGADELPKPQAVIENAFDFAQKLLDAQRDFSRSVVAAAAPVIEKSAPTTNGSKTGK
jgi:hypothetical protein